MSGWIKLHKELRDHPLWLSEPFTKGQAWVDMLMLASHEDTYFYIRGVKVDQARGQICMSENNMALRYRWSRSKLRKFLNDLEKEQQIIQQKNNVIQVLTVVNYEKYQEKEPQTIQQKDRRKTAERPNKEYKEEFFPFSQELIHTLSIEKNLVDEWLRIRKDKKLTNTETALKGLKSQIEKSGLTANECIRIAVEKSWGGFEAKWVENLRNKNQNSSYGNKSNIGGSKSANQNEDLFCGVE